MCSGGESLMIVKIFSYLKYLHQHRLGGVGNIPIDIKFFLIWLLSSYFSLLKMKNCSMANY